MLDGDAPPAVVRSCVGGVDVDHVPPSADREGLAALSFDPDARAPIVGGHRGSGLEEQVPLVESDLFFVKMFEEHGLLFLTVMRALFAVLRRIIRHEHMP